MILTKDNIQDWKNELDRLYFEATGIKNLSECNDDSTWLDLHEGDTAQDAVDTDLYYGASN